MSSRSTDMTVKLCQIGQAFRIEGSLQSYEEIKIGNINQTYRVLYRQEDAPTPGSTESRSYIAQRINTYVFKDPVAVMENIDMVTGHIRVGYPDRECLHFHQTADGRSYLFDGDGFWRLSDYIPSRICQTGADPETVWQAGLAFGEFQRMLADFDASRLHVTIPDFHDTRKRYEKLIADAAADREGRIGSVRKELEWLLSVQDKACLLTDLSRRGELPIRVTHNDTKINNVLFAPDGSRAIAVIDLDTVMPGLVGHDFGDAIRSAANRVEEDCPRAEEAGVNMEVFRKFTEGFLSVTAQALTERERDTLACACFALTCEQAVRFLDDYILGDPYFRILYPEHNLVRTRCQIALARDMLAKMERMEKIVREAYFSGGEHDEND